MFFGLDAIRPDEAPWVGADGIIEQKKENGVLGASGVPLATR
ncbi:hypothetical protein [Paeniglutamicibacter cryotolerans]|uniref:Uncharacterized protein n=1 Tax=Paeniglutamicibacter cryotolerans TaxID=670079 RepID=A0A839QGL1_9MICC|nr:hypothetical protein [Paeniglutamicibacter cryotolerans]MBB2994753.1 hypothetical protein [Paeniglutamicibacter cryotolerans]